MSSIRLRYQTIVFGELDVHVRTLKDNQQFSDNFGVAERLGISSATWPLFGIVWDSGHLLAHLMLEHEIKGKRILEVGCGIALSSLLLNQRNADITATDYHPEAGNFLIENTRLNHDKDIPFIRTDWADENTGLGLFDMIIGSDLLYEAEHVDLLSNFINQHAKAICEVILIDPGRGHHAKFSKKMVLHGFEHSQFKPEETDFLNKPFKGQVLKYCRSSIG